MKKILILFLLLPLPSFAEDYTQLQIYLKENKKPSADRSIEIIDKGVYLYANEGAAIERGLYYVDTNKNIHHRLSGGSPVVLIKKYNNNKTFVLLYTQGFWKGIMSDDYIASIINSEGRLSNNRILSYSQSGESGFCAGVETQLKIAGEVINHRVVETESGYEIIFNVKEQNCESGEYSEKEIKKQIEYNKSFKPHGKALLGPSKATLFRAI